MFALLEIARIYKALKRFADLQGPICYNGSKAQFKCRTSRVSVSRARFFLCPLLPSACYAG